MAIITEKEVITHKGLKVKVRSPVLEDAEGILRLGKAVIAESEFQVTEADEFQMTIDKEKEWIKSMKSEDSNIVILAEVDRKIIGMIDFHINSKRRRLSHTGSFGMSIYKEYRNRGVGTLLVKELLSWATAHKKIEKVSLAVLASNKRAIHMYKKLGFLEEGRRYRFIKKDAGNYVDDIMMYKWVQS